MISTNNRLQALVLVAAAAVFPACASTPPTATPGATAAAPAETAAPVAKPSMVSPAEWGSEPLEFPEDYRQTPIRVLLHHAGEKWKVDSDPMKKIKGLQIYGAREKNWKDVPYHFMIAPDGRIFEGRSVAYKPDSNTKFDTTGCINVHLWGNFEEQRVNEAQLAATVTLTAWLLQEYRIPPTEILTHKDIAPGQTTCPGRDFYQYISGGQFASWLADTRAGRTPAITLLPPLAEGPTVMIGE